MINRKTIPLLIVICSVIAGTTGKIPAACTETNASHLMFIGDFEKRDLSQLGDSQLEYTLKKTEVVTTPVRHGNYALKLTLNREAHPDAMSHRTDFWIRGMSQQFKMEEDYWYGFSSYWPNAWQPDTQSELFVQWVGWRKHGPSLAIYVYGKDYCIKKRWGAGNSYENLWRGTITKDRGKWIDWVFHIKWSAGEDGFVNVWKNGEKIISDTGRNCAPGKFAPYFKFGIYKWPWKKSPEEMPSAITQRTLFIDEIRIGDKTAGYQLVSPPR